MPSSVGLKGGKSDKMSRKTSRGEGRNGTSPEGKSRWLGVKGESEKWTTKYKVPPSLPSYLGGKRQGELRRHRPGESKAQRMQPKVWKVISQIVNNVSEFKRSLSKNVKKKEPDQGGNGRVCQNQQRRHDDLHAAIWSHASLSIRKVGAGGG